MARLIRASGMPHCEESFTQTSLTVAAIKTADVTERLHTTYNAYWAIYQEKGFDQAIFHYQDQEHAIRKIMGDDPRVKWDI
jgi:hypothetical protein